MTVLRIALDWTPNINHVGILMAQEKGWFAEAGIVCNILDPAADHYQLTPGKKLELDQADLAIAPFETVISLNNKANPVAATAVYALLQEDTSCIATLHQSGIDRPALLAGKIYASYKARYEDGIVQAMLRKDGATAPANITYPDKLGIWNTVINGQADATWIFDNWEGVEADTQGIGLHKFRLADYGIPYGYSPVILTKKQFLADKQQLLSDALSAIKRGYLLAGEDPGSAVAVLKKYVPAHDQQRIDLAAAVRRSAPYFGNAQTCGVMTPERVQTFLQWLVAQGLETGRILEQELFTNELVQSKDVVAATQ